MREQLNPVKVAPTSQIKLPDGYAFHPRCPNAGRNGNRSFTEVPELRGQVHQVACHMSQEERNRLFQQDVLPNL